MFKIMKLVKKIQKSAYLKMKINSKDNLQTIKTLNKKIDTKIQAKNNIFMKQIFYLVLNRQKFKYNMKN